MKRSVALALPLLEPGMISAIVGLVFYGIMSILRNTVAGLESVRPSQWYGALPSAFLALILDFFLSRMEQVLLPHGMKLRESHT